MQGGLDNGRRPEQVFISYDREDQSNLDSIAAAVREAGLTPWFDQKLKGGQRFPHEIRNAIKASKFLLVVLSKDSLQSEWVGHEVEEAQRSNKRIIPLAKNLNLAEVKDPEWAVKIRNDVHAITYGIRISRRTRGEIVEALRALQEAPKDGRVLAFVNFKGGVGKTTLCALAGLYASSERQQRTLLIDLDPQENLSDLFLGRDAYSLALEESRTSISLFEPGRLSLTFPPEYDYRLFLPHEYSAANATSMGAMPIHLLKDGQLSFIPADFRMVKFARGTVIEHSLYRRNFLRAVTELKKRFDLVFLDCGPTASLLSQCALSHSDFVIAPVQPNTSAVRGLYNMARAADVIFDMQIREKIFCVFNMIRGTKAETGYIAQFRQGLTSEDISFVANQIFRTEIPRVEVLTNLNQVLDVRALDFDEVNKAVKSAAKPLSDFTEELVRLTRTGAVRAG